MARKEVNPRTPTEFDDDIFMIHDDGHAPSEIDRVLELKPGTAHDSVVNMWILDKQGRRKLRSKWATRKT